MTFFKHLFLIAATYLLTACTHSSPPPMTARHVDLNQYQGTWYEIASLPNYFQRGCHCTRAEYMLEGNDVKVSNSCYRGEPLKYSSATAKAWATDSSNSRLKVRFFWPFTGDYWVLYVSPDYQYALVGTPSRSYLWLLARQPEISDVKYQQLINIALEQKYDLKKLKKTDQSCFTKKNLSNVSAK